LIVEGHVQSASHSTNHLGEGLRQEPITALAGYHLIWVSECTENVGHCELSSHKKPASAALQHYWWM
ncbi:hypothetical protein J4Q44_G00271060, partial [Coregonus suidteri]